MKRIPRSPLVGVVCLGVAVAVAVLVLGQGGATPAAAQPADPHYKCYTIVGPPAGESVSVETQFGLEPSVVVQVPSALCLPAGKNGAPIPPGWPVLKCYVIAGQDPPNMATLTTQFGVENRVPVGQATLLCVPAAMTILPAPPEPIPPPPDRHWECYDIVGSDPPDVVNLTTYEFPAENNVAVGQATKLCAPALKNGDGDLEAFPHLKCYNITGDPPAVPAVNLTTQFGIEPGVVVGPPSLLCVPALKQYPFGVGGVAELPALEPGAAAETSTSNGSGWSAGGYTALAAGLAAAAVVIGAGGWYARRRWLR